MAAKSKEYCITYRPSPRSRSEKLLVKVIFTSRRTAERYARKHFTAQERARVRTLLEE
jgi:hypothetical protein